MACSGEAEVAADARGPCWPESLPTPNATGDEASLRLLRENDEGELVPLESLLSVALERGPQSGYHLTLTVRALGIEPGETDNILSPNNPRTRVTAYSLAGDDIDKVTCPTRLGFTETAEGELELLRGYLLVMDDSRVRQIYGTEIIVVAELIDAQGIYLKRQYNVWVEDPARVDPFDFPTKATER